jgi:curli biogenesis system outer membrane secretion channel CsgG
MALMAMANGMQNPGVQGLGSGTGNMLMTALKETNCFKIVDLDRYKKMKEKLEATGQVVTPPKIDFFVNLNITSVELSKDGGALGGGLLSGIPLIGGITKTDQSAKMGVDVSINDITLETTASKAFNATSEKTSWGFSLGGLLGRGGLAGGGWSVSKNIALDTVARDVVFSSANFIAESLVRDKITDRSALVVSVKKD